MAVRTTEEAVEGIIEVDSSISLTPFIETANALVTSCCDDTVYTAAQLELVERWLAAHFYAICDPRAVSEHAGPVGATYQSRVDLGFHVTHYGQQAMALDTEGGLAALNRRIVKGEKKITPSISWLGITDWDTDNI